MSDQQTPDWISLARDAYSASNTYFDASIRNGIEQDLRQFQSQHPSNSKYLAESGRGRSKLFRPKTRAVIRKNEAAAAEAFFSTNDVVSVSPEDDNDPRKKASALVMQELLQYRLTKTLPWFQLVIGAYQDAQAVGVVASYQSWLFNPAKGIDRPDIRLVPIENLRFDAAANWTDPVNTSPYVIELIPMYVKDVKARMQNADPKTGEPKWHPLDDGDILQATRHYSDTIRLQREGQGRTDSKTQSQAYNAFNVVWIHKNIIEVNGVDYCYYTLGTEQLLSDPVPLDQLYFHGKRPYVIGCAVIETHKIYPSSVPRLTKDVQAEINEIANQRIDNVKLVLNKRYFAKRNKQVDLRSITRNVPGSVTLMQDTDDVKAVEFSDVTASSYKEQEVLNLDFDDMAGAFSGSSVQSNRQMNETVGGMQMLDTNANQVSGYQLRTFVETWVEPVLRQLVMLEQFYETDDTLLALCGQQAQLAQKFGIDTVTDEMLMNEFTLNVNVGLGATNPAHQVDRFIQAMSALRDIVADNTLVNYGLNVQEVIKELFGKLGYKDGGRFFDMDKQDPQIIQLQNAVQELQQALEAKENPELVAAQIRKLDAEIKSLAIRDKKDVALAVKTMVEAEFSAMQGAEVVAAVPQVAPIADELMRAAGYQAPNPAGMDPNFPQPALPAPAPAPAALPAAGGMGAGASTLEVPQPATPGMGVREGIETTRADSAGYSPDGPIAAYANGGRINSLMPRLSGFEGLSPSEQGAAMIDKAMQMVDAGTMSREQAAAVREQAGYVANPGYRNTNPMGDISDMFGINNRGGMDRALTSEFYGRGNILSNFADGGLIQGPGTGTSDSIAAVAEGQPLAVSDGEYAIPAEVVQALGEDFFEALLQQFHTPIGGPNGPMPASDSPLPLENGTFIVPADVVEALGRDFFDKLIEHYGTSA